MKPYYERDGAVIYHGDALDVLREVPLAFDTCVGDPPYSSGGRSQASARATFSKSDSREDWFLGDNMGVDTYIWWMRGLALRSCVVWDKDRGGAMGSFWRNNHEWIPVFTKGPARALTHCSAFNTWRGQKPQGDEHPTVKPDGLIRYVLMASGGAAVLDPFMGSGTTLLAAKALGLRSIGIEIEERYCEIAAERLSQRVLDLAEPQAQAAV